jgi:hypothetical protein
MAYGALCALLLAGVFPAMGQLCEIKGDMNCDEVVNCDDIDAFVLAIGNQAGYEAAYPDCVWLNGDIDGDLDVDFDDIDPFVALLEKRPIKGDMNCDGCVTYDGDWAYLLEAYFTPCLYLQDHAEGCPLSNGDIDDDGDIDLADIQLFGELLNGHVKGDMNCDQCVDDDDVDPFVLALGNQAGYEAAYPDCHWLNGDIDGDNDVDFDDINPFNNLLDASCD